MPELPEVETARRTLEPLVVGRRIERLEVPKPQVLRSHAPPEAHRVLSGRLITGMDRRGKALLFRLDRGWVMAFHYALWGVVLTKPAGEPDAATAAIIYLDGGRVVEFRDLQLSSLNLYREAELDRVPFFAGLGPDPLDPRLTFDRFRRALAGRGALAGLLTNQGRLAGIGNLWAQEILFAAGLRPSRRAATVSEDDWRHLYRATRSVLRRAVRAGGEPEFPDATGRRGRYRLAVYGRAGQPCWLCRTKVAAGRVGGRPAFYCPKCQK